MTLPTRGKDLILYYVFNGVSKLVCMSTDCKITVQADTIESTTRNSLKGKTFEYQGKYSYTLSLKGITNFIDGANVAAFQQYIMQSNKLGFIFTDSMNIQWSGTVLITSNDLDSPVENISTFTNEMIGDGELTIVTTNVPPIPSNADYVTIQNQLGTILAQISAPGTYTVLQFDTIDLHSIGISPLLVITLSA